MQADCRVLSGGPLGGGPIDRGELVGGEPLAHDATAVVKAGFGVVRDERPGRVGRAPDAEKATRSRVVEDAGHGRGLVEVSMAIFIIGYGSIG